MGASSIKYTGITGVKIALLSGIKNGEINNTNAKTRITRYEMPNITFLGTISVKDDRRFHAYAQVLLFRILEFRI